MTIERAIKVLKDMVPKTCKMVNGRYVGGFEDTECPQFEAIQVVVEAIQKQIPKKPSETDKARCIHCACVVKRDERFCKNCGQALDWSESE